jgi:hypothetical protein
MNLIKSDAMAILAILKANGLTKEMYETIRKEVDLEHQHPDGAILLSVAFDNSGKTFQAADVWESEEHLNKFVTDRLLPIMKKNNIPMPEGENFQIHNLNAFSGIDKYRV